MRIRLDKRAKLYKALRYNTQTITTMNIANLLINPIISSNEEASSSSSLTCKSQSKSLLSCLSTKAFFTRTQQQQYCVLYGNVRDLKPRDVTVSIFEYML
jgi:hypothetical protein